MRKVYYIVTFTGVLLMSHFSYAQRITGKVTDENGMALPGASVVEANTTNGTITGINGDYSLSVSEGATLLFSFVGYAAQEIAVNDLRVIDVQMQVDARQLEDVVVTALGISRDRESLTYGVQAVDGGELNKAQEVNFINSLSGKTSGLQISRSGSGAGGSARVVLRGNSSSRNNNVLYVIDGVPMNNFSPSQPTNLFGDGINASGGESRGGTGRDGGDGIGNLNPDDIESVTVLKGASAAALYGSQAANGVILITTKKGKAGKTKVSFSSNLTLESILVKPKLQYSYAQTEPGATQSWGSAEKSADHVDKFFNIGQTWINNLSVSGGNEQAQTYFSYANTRAKGVLPTNDLNRHAFTLKETLNLSDSRVQVNGRINYILQEIDNKPVSGFYFNPMTGLYWFPRGLDFNAYDTEFEIRDQSRNLMAQNWISDEDTQQNPYWILRRNKSSDIRQRLIGQLDLNFKLKGDELQLKLRGNIDRSNDRHHRNVYATTQGTLSDINGRYIYSDDVATQFYGDAILSYNRFFETFSFSANVGSSITRNELSATGADAKGGDDIRFEGVEGLFYPNIFTLQNIALGGAASFYEGGYESELQSVFGTFNLGYKNTIYADFSGRNDWSSTLPGKPFFYSSAGLSALATEMVDINNVDLLKVRFSVAQVGNGVNPYDIGSFNANLVVPYGSLTRPNAVVPEGSTLDPEIQTALELGSELVMFNGRLSTDIALYRTITKNQRLSIQAPPATGYKFYYINAGEIQNQGIELFLSGSPIKINDFEWSATVNYTANRSKVVSLTDQLDNETFFLTEAGVNNYAMVIKKGSQFGDIYGKKFKRNDSGAIIVDGTGKPQTEGDLGFVGNPNPRFLLGWTNSFRYKNFSLSFLIDGRFGGQVMSVTEAMNDLRGVSKTSADARDKGGVNIDAVTSDNTSFGPIDPKTFYTAVGGRAGTTEHYMYSATNIRLRELYLGYSLPEGLFNSVFIESMTVSLIGRNLFFLRNDAPFDPDIAMSTGTGLQGVHAFSVPATRSIGFNISIDF